MCPILNQMPILISLLWRPNQGGTLASFWWHCMRGNVSDPGVRSWVVQYRRIRFGCSCSFHPHPQPPPPPYYLYIYIDTTAAPYVSFCLIFSVFTDVVFTSLSFCLICIVLQAQLPCDWAVGLPGIGVGRCHDLFPKVSALTPGPQASLLLP